MAPLTAGQRLWGRLLRGLGAEWPVPPSRWRGRVGKGEFCSVGRDLVDLAVATAGLHADHRVLDLGCGVGRLVDPLRRALGPRGSYEGLDIVPEFIRWNRRRVTPVDPRFRFRLAPVRNDAYHPAGIPASSYAFPYADADFDTILATSLFTHLLAADARRYLSECARVLAPGGRLFATFFLLDDEVLERMSERATDILFPWPVPYGRIAEWRQPEFAVAFELWALMAALDEAGLVLVGPIRRGTWSGVEGPTYQDLAIMARPGDQSGSPRSPVASGTTMAP